MNANAVDAGDRGDVERPSVIVAPGQVGGSAEAAFAVGAVFLADADETEQRALRIEDPHALVAVGGHVEVAQRVHLHPIRGTRGQGQDGLRPGVPLREEEAGDLSRQALRLQLAEDAVVAQPPIGTTSKTRTQA